MINSVVWAQYINVTDTQMTHVAIANAAPKQCVRHQKVSQQMYAALQFILLLALIQHTPVTYGDYNYPPWAVAVGWMFALCSILPLPLIAIFKVISSKGPIFKVFDSIILLLCEAVM